MTREKAIQLGLSVYPADRPCKRGHSLDRYVKGNRCAECVRLHALKSAAKVSHTTKAIRRLRCVSMLQTKRPTLRSSGTCLGCGAPVEQPKIGGEKLYCSYKCRPRKKSRANTVGSRGPSKHKTVKAAAEALLLQVSYVDIYGRNVGLTYKTILKKLHEGFPNGSPNWPGFRTSLRSLQMVAYALNGSDRKMPVRRRSLKVLARDFARTLLLKTDDTGTGLSYVSIARRTKSKFPEYPYLSAEQLAGLELYLAKQFKLPPRPKK